MPGCLSITGVPPYIFSEATRCLGLALLSSTLVAFADSPAPLALLPRPAVVKRAATAVDDNFEARQLIVKFKDGLHFHAVDGKLTNVVQEEIAPVQPLLDSLPKAHWRRVDKISEEQMESIRQTAQSKLGRAL